MRKWNKDLLAAFGRRSAKPAAMSDKAAFRLLAVIGAVAVVQMAGPAFAQTAIESGLTTIKTWMTTIASVVGVIAVMAVGYAKLTGRIDWGKAVAVLIGLGIIFSAATIVGWMGGSAG